MTGKTGRASEIMAAEHEAIDLGELGQRARARALQQGALRRLETQFRQHDHRLYLVGGYLRDLLLDLPVDEKDVDLATDARPEESLELARRLGWPTYDVGKRFGTIGVRHGAGTVEITTFRTDCYRGDDRHPEVAFGDDILEDLVRRDLTINSLAVSLSDGPLLDPAGGIGDLRRHRIRVTGDPAQRFAEDPLRLMRVVRFAAQLGFHLDAATEAAVRRTAGSLAIVSRERVRGELDKILLSDRAAFGLRLLVELDLMAQIAPPVDAMKHFTDEGKQRFKNLLTHTLRVVENTPPELVLRLAALLHDVGKPRTLSVTNGQVHFFEHERVGAAIARDIMVNLRYDTATSKEVLALIQNHMRPASDTDTWTDSAVRRFVREIGEDRLMSLFALARADVTSSNPRKVSGHLLRLERLIERCRQAVEEMHAVKPESPLDGEAIMALTGLKPGPAIGRIKAYLLNLVLDGELAPDDAAGAEQRMRAFMAAQGIESPH
jgi:poly(A) polymerase